MSATCLSADCVFVVHLRSYGFFHSGRERLRVQVLKRTWEHIPGATLYGAMAAALMRLLDEGIKPASADLSSEGAYFELLRAVEAKSIRFTPLLPASAELRSGEAYCEQAMALLEGLYGREKAQETGRRLLHTTPHAPLSRATEQIHGDQLFALRTHRPQLDYYGFVFGQAQYRTWLETALSLFPVMPVGGQGKFSLVEGKLLDEVPRADFRRKLQEWATTREGWVRLLTPLVLPVADMPEPLSTEAVEEMVMTRFRRYRVWRTGRYFDGESFGKAVGIEPGYHDEKAPFLPGGVESVAVQAVPEHSRFRLKNVADAVRWFIEGTGHPGWSYLGWGQVVIE